MKVRLRGSILAALLLAAPAVLQAQDPAAAQTQLPPEVQALLLEAQQIQQHLAPLEQRVLQDSALQAEHQEITIQVTTAMMQSDPELETQVQRMQALQEEVQRAQAAGDEERIAAIFGKANQIQGNVAAAQARVLEQPEIAARVEAFTARLHSRMIAEDQEAAAMITRLEEIRSEMAAAAGVPLP